MVTESEIVAAPLQAALHERGHACLRFGSGHELEELLLCRSKFCDRSKTNSLVDDLLSCGNRVSLEAGDAVGEPLDKLIQLGVGLGRSPAVS